jgi:2-polyprenyl-6-hydroxyphenyl methylase/3-demethylubiquinone-9 3-methyltransferase
MTESVKSSLDPDEVARFTKMCAQWWDENGPFKPLHHLNPTRIKLIRDHILLHQARPFDQNGDGQTIALKSFPPYQIDTTNLQIFQGVSILDVGCGGGLVCEPLCRLGGQITGIDGSGPTIEVAKAHSALMGLDIDYRVSTIEELVASGESYDVVLALEIVEHVANVHGFVKSCIQVLKPGGIIIFSTLNRTLKSYLVAILGAEYLMRWLPRGTHNWSKFLTPAELAAPLRENNVNVTAIQGMVFNPLQWTWGLSQDSDVNYFMVGTKADT